MADQAVNKTLAVELQYFEPATGDFVGKAVFDALEYNLTNVGRIRQFVRKLRTAGDLFALKKGCKNVDIVVTVPADEEDPAPYLMKISDGGGSVSFHGRAEKNTVITGGIAGDYSPKG